MTRTELMQMIDEDFEMYADGKFANEGLEGLRTRVRESINMFLDELEADASEINAILERKTK